MAGQVLLSLVNGQIVEVAVTGGSAAVPTYVAAADTFNVPANTQVLFSAPIDVDGSIDLDGVLVEVN